MFQQTIVMGNLGGDPEIRFMQDGKAVTNFSVATNRKWKDANGETAEEVTWFRVSVWGNQAEACNEYLKKGSAVLVIGRLKPDPTSGGPKLWSRDDGSMGANFEIVGQNVRFLPASDIEGSGGSPSSRSRPVVEEDEIPF